MPVMTDQQYADLIEFLERKFEEAQIYETLLYERLRDELEAMERRLDDRIDGVAVRLEEMEHRQTGGSSAWGARMPQA